MNQPSAFYVNPRKRTVTMRTGYNQYQFDRTGRLNYAIMPRKVLKRGLDNRLLEVTVSDWPYAGMRTYRDLDDTEKSVWLGEVYGLARKQMTLCLPKPTRSALHKVADWTPEALSRDSEAFHRVYKPVSILPPDEYHALVVQVTEGCSYNRCAFCDFYRDRKFHIKSEEELRRHVKGIHTFLGDRVGDFTNVFLGDGNAFMIPTDGLVSALSILREEFGEVANAASTFMDTFTFDKKGDDELRAIRTANLDTVYVGFETGNDSLREWLKKPGDASTVLSALNRCKAAGFRLGVIVLVGVGGREIAQDHLKDTVRVLSEVKFTKGDTIYLSPFVEPEGIGYQKAMDALYLSPMSDLDIMGEMTRFKRSLEGLTPARLTHYFISEHIY